MKPDGGGLEDGRFAGVVAGVGGPRVLDDEVAPRVLPVLGEHCDPAPKHKGYIEGPIIKHIFAVNTSMK